MNTPRKACIATVAVILTVVLGPQVPKVAAHCDTMDGPIVPEAQRALETGDLTPVLKWVRPQDEAALRQAFKDTRAVRDQSGEIRRLVDRYFLETLIRIHREGEGAPYTGLKPAGSVPPVFAKADAALEQGSVDELADEIAAAVRAGIAERFNVALEARKHADESVAKGREYVAAYVRYMHFVEGIHECVQHAPPEHHFPDGDESPH